MKLIWIYKLLTFQSKKKFTILSSISGSTEGKEYWHIWNISFIVMYIFQNTLLKNTGLQNVKNVFSKIITINVSLLSKIWKNETKKLLNTVSDIDVVVVSEYKLAQVGNDKSY